MKVEYRKIKSVEFTMDIPEDNVRGDKIARPGEISFTVETELDTEPVACPRCSVINHLPDGFYLGLMTEDPVPCVGCGYPLL